MSLYKRIIAIFATFALVFSFFSCEQEEEKPNTRVFYEYFDTFGTLYDYSGGSYEDFDKVADEVDALLREYHELYDIYNTYDGINNLATLNSQAGEGPVSVDEKIIDLLEYGIEMYHITKGEVNIAFGSVLKIWHDFREEGVSVPEIELLEEANLHTDIDKIVIDREAGTVELLDRDMSIDVGAVAKGYAVEMIAKYLKGRDLNSYFLDMGGNLKAIGTKPDGSAWKGAVKNPVNDGYAEIFELSDSALVTSGIYERFYTVGGVRYHHIIDKDTLFPKNDYLSVSIHAPSSAMADALSTALFNMELKEAEALIGALPDVTAVFIFENGEVKTVPQKSEDGWDKK